MRTNLTGFALTVGMGLVFVMMVFLGLSAADLVGFSASEGAQVEQPVDKDKVPAPNDSTALLTSAKGEKLLTPDEEASIVVGDALFKANCTQCHAVNEKVVGPALMGITKRRPTSWIVSWVHNPAKVIASGDAYAGKLFDDYGKQQMPSFPQLSEKDIKAIITWVESQEGSGAMIDDSSLLAENHDGIASTAPAPVPNTSALLLRHHLLLDLGRAG